MGFNNTESLRYVVDIETAPIADAIEYIDLSDITAPANYKDPDKIKAYCEAEQLKRVGKSALDLDLCRVVALGFIREDWNEPDVRVTPTEREEASALEAFWRELRQRITIGYNQVGFDLPVMLRRSLYLGVHAPAINLDKYRSPHIDLQQRLSLNGTKPYRSLNWYCRRFKLDVPTDANTGKEIGDLVAEGNWSQVAEHCRVDVLKTRALAERLGLVRELPEEDVDSDSLLTEREVHG